MTEKPLGKLLLQEDIDREQKVTMVRPDGTVVTLPMSQRMAAAQQGYTMAGGEEIAGASEARAQRRIGSDPFVAAGAFSAGALRTTTLGLSDLAIAQAATGDYEEGAAGLAGMREAAPGASVAGEIAGALNPYSPVGAIGLGARAGGGLLARAGLGALSGAGEGALLGAGKAVSDAVLEGGPLTWERVAQEMGPGALWGGAFGGALPVAGAAVKGAAKRALLPTGARSLEQAAKQSAVRAIGGTTKKADDVGELLLRYEMKSGPRAGQPLMRAFATSDNLANDVRQMRDEISAELASVRQAVAGSSAPVFAGWARRVGKRAEELRATDPAAALVLEKKLGELHARISDDVFSAVKRAPEPERGLAFDDTVVGGRLDDTVVEPNLLTRAEGDTIVDPQYLKTQLDPGAIKTQLSAGSAPARGRALTSGPGETNAIGRLPDARRLSELIEGSGSARGEFRAAFDDALLESEGAALRSIGQDPSAIKRLQSDLLAAERAVSLVDDASKMALTQRNMGATNAVFSGLGAMLSGHVGAIPAGLGGRAAYRFISDRWDSSMASLARSMLSRSERVDAAARTIAGLGVAARKTAAAVATRGPKPAPPAAPERKRRARETDLAAADETISRVEGVSRMSAEYRIEALSRSPVVMLLARSDPRLARGVIQQALKMQEVLETRLPHRYWRATYLQRQYNKPRMTRADRLKFARFARGVEAPLDVIEDLAAGNLDRDALEGLAAAHPTEWESLQRSVIEYVTENEGELEVSRRRMIGMAFGLPTDSSLDPEHISSAQDSWEEMQKERQEEKKGNGGNKAAGKTTAESWNLDASISPRR